MDISSSKPLQKNAYTVLRQAGYIPILDRQSGKESFVLKIHGDRYPRFHVYVEDESANGVKLHLHLDHREHGWGERRHDTQYDSEPVREEAERLRRWLAHFMQTTPAKPVESKTQTAPQDTTEKKGFWSSLLGK